MELKIPADASYISLVRLVLASYLREKSIAIEEDIEDLKLVVGEFLAKSIEANLVGKYIPIQMSCDDEVIEINIMKIEEFKPDELFDSPYLNMKTISKLVDDFDLLMAENQLITVKIVKKFEMREADES